MTVPKLELTAATLATFMNETILKEVSERLNIDSVAYWTDSMIVLGYIRNESRRFLTFVANRIEIIRQRSEPSQWRHIKSEDNPADYASRGLPPYATEKIDVWKNGPCFLWNDVSTWPPQPDETMTELTDDHEGVKREVKAFSVSVEHNQFWDVLFRAYSTWTSLVKTVAWLFRIIETWKCFRRGYSDKKIKPLLVKDIENSEREIMKQVQSLSFPDELMQVPNKCKRQGRFASLKPYVEDGILRVGGRLQKSDLSHDMKHPVILPGKHPVTEMVVRHFHMSNGHVGTHQVLALTRQKYWIVKGVSSKRRILRKCHTCRRENARVGEQVIAPLPAVRCSADEQKLIYPFAAVGIDYFGLLMVKSGRATRSQGATKKKYGCIFTCLRYRAVHIELAEDLTTDSFMNALIRFIGRRGPPSVIYSDIGTNLRGAETEVLQALRGLDQERVHDALLQKRIRWVFNPPAASHQGGLWERLIRSAKRILRSMLGQSLVKEETLTTFLVETERIMNDRPITRVSGDVNDLEALTPNHILLMRGNPRTFTDSDEKVRDHKLRWKQVKRLGEEFQERWRREYLPTLQESQKWLKEKPGFKVGDLVLVVDSTMPKGQWPKGIVAKTLPDRDGVVRQVEIKTASGRLRRDIRKLCMLEEDLICEIEKNVLGRPTSTPCTDMS